LLKCFLAKVFSQSLPPDLIRGLIPVRVKKTHQNKRERLGSDPIRTEKASAATDPVDRAAVVPRRAMTVADTPHAGADPADANTRHPDSSDANAGRHNDSRRYGRPNDAALRHAGGLAIDHCGLGWGSAQ
jgi:hypothetical protein